MGKKNDKNRGFIEEERFINPYHFSPLGEIHRKPVEAWEDPKDSHTGVIHCSLTTRTPLIIPDKGIPSASNHDHKEYPFMKIDDTYMIPASSLRGPIRSMYEAMTDSCFSTIQNNQLITNRTKTPYVPGLVYKNGDTYELFPAERYLIVMEGKVYRWIDPKGANLFNRDSVELHHGSKVYFRKSNNGHKKLYYVQEYEISTEGSSCPDGYNEGYLYCGESFSRKHFESIFHLKDGGPLEIESEKVKSAIDHLGIIKDLYNDPAINLNQKKGHQGYRHIKSLAPRDGEFFPIWYLESNGQLYFSLAQVGRMVYNTTMNEVIKDFDACQSRNAVCPACALFGMKNAEEGNGVGSHIRFYDARLVAGKNASEEINELATPKPSYLPFYLKGEGYKSLSGYDGKNVEIAGRKQYFHHQPKENVYKNTGLLNERNAKMEMIQNALFSFDVYFDCITKEQLDDLIWMLCLGENNAESARFLKIGHGKPFGFGSVKIMIDGIEERNLQEGYQVTRYAGETLSRLIQDIFNHRQIEQQATLKHLKRFIDFGGAGEKEDVPVRYPYAIQPENPRNYKENSYASHQWFSYNFKMGSKNSNTRTLPSLDQQDISLPAYKPKLVDKSNKNERNNNHRIDNIQRGKKK